MTNDSSPQQDMNTKQYLGVNKSQGLAYDKKRVNVTIYCELTIHQKSVLWSLRKSEMCGVSAAK